MSPLLERVRAWPEHLRERFLELSGFHLSDGVPQGLADQRAYLTLRGEAKEVAR